MHEFISKNEREITSDEFRNQSVSIDGFLAAKIGLSSNIALQSFILTKSVVYGSSLPHRISQRRFSRFRTRHYEQGSRIGVLDFESNSKMISIDPHVLLSELNGELNANIALTGQFSNSVIFRHRTRDDRVISVINPHLTAESRENIAKNFKHIARIFYKIYEGLGLANDSVVGFIKRKSYIDHAKAHLGCESAVSIDINKFYNSISLTNIIENNLFYKALCASFYRKTGLVFEIESFRDAHHYDVLFKIFGTMNIQFIAAMNFLTHNGLLPTGAHYSPTVSNLILGGLDLEIMSMLDNDDHEFTYTRYADDICISTRDVRRANGEFAINIDLVKRIEQDIHGYGFYLNYDKTNIMGAKDRKQIAGIVLDHNSGENRLSIGSAKKLALRERFNGREWRTLSSSDLGTINWVKTINLGQHAFVCGGLLGDAPVREEDASEPIRTAGVDFFADDEIMEPPF